MFFFQQVILELMIQGQIFVSRFHQVEREIITCLHLWWIKGFY